MIENINSFEGNTYGSSEKHILTRREFRRRKQRRRLAVFFAVLMVLLGICGYCVYDLLSPQGSNPVTANNQEQNNAEELLQTQGGLSQYPDELIELLERNKETLDFVKNYTKRDAYKNQRIDLKGEYIEGEVPLLFQWDKRWGYNNYGDNMIAIAGCGPTCLSMAYIYLTGDLSKNPRVMAEYAYENGFYTSDGTAWSLWTGGVSGLGLSGKELSLDENIMKSRLDNGQVIICSMGPGDFTTTGHIILIRGYDDKGFYVNDPNRNSNSSRQWTFQQLYSQIKNLWALSVS